MLFSFLFHVSVTDHKSSLSLVIFICGDSVVSDIFMMVGIFPSVGPKFLSLEAALLMFVHFLSYPLRMKLILNPVVLSFGVNMGRLTPQQRYAF